MEENRDGSPRPSRPSSSSSKANTSSSNSFIAFSAGLGSGAKPLHAPPSLPRPHELKYRVLNWNRYEQQSAMMPKEAGKQSSRNNQRQGTVIPMTNLPMAHFDHKPARRNHQQQGAINKRPRGVSMSDDEICAAEALTKIIGKNRK